MVRGARPAGAARPADALACRRQPGRRVADRRRSVGRVGLALRVGRARAARVGVLRAAYVAAERARAVAARAMAVAGLADALEADVARAVLRIGRALRVARAPAARVRRRDSAELAGGAIAARPVAVARDASAREANGGRAVGRIDAARRVAGARVTGARRRIADRAARAVG